MRASMRGYERFVRHIKCVCSTLERFDGAREHIEVGGLIYYAPPTFPTLYRRAAEYVDKILRGAKPGTSLSSNQPNSI